MVKKYRLRFPIACTWFRWGLTIAWLPPVVRIEDDSISIFLNFFDEE
jgi:hypothetical protein